jgi:hypothetical protein
MTAAQNESAGQLAGPESAAQHENESGGQMLPETGVAGAPHR